MRILITGATGFVGFRLVQALQADGHDLIATGRNLRMGERIAYLGVPFHQGPIEDADFVKGLLKGCDAVVHTAGLSSPWGRYLDFERANVDGTRHVVNACLQHGVKRLVHLSTPSLYVNGQDRLDIREEDPLPTPFANAYAETKFRAEGEIQKGIQQGLDVVMLRPRAIIGAGDTVIMPRLLRAHESGTLRVIGDGRNRVDLTSVSNICDAVILGLSAQGEALGKAYNITNGHPVVLWDTLRQAFEMLGLTLSRRKVPFFLAYSMAAAMEKLAQGDPRYIEPALTRYGVVMLGRSQTLNISRARLLLGYEPKQSTTEAMEEFAHWWQQSQWKPTH